MYFESSCSVSLGYLGQEWLMLVAQDLILAAIIGGAAARIQSDLLACKRAQPCPSLADEIPQRPNESKAGF